MGCVLLTGASGFVGRHVLGALVKRGTPVRVIVRSASQEQVAHSRGAQTIITTPDLFAQDTDWAVNAFVDVDTVIHVAWHATPGEYLHSSKNLDCLLGTLQLAKAATEAGVKRFVGIGTCLEYDLKEGTLSVETPLRPLTPYAGAKCAAFMALSQWLPPQGVEFAWCRLFYLYGAGEDSRRLVPYLRARLSACLPADLTHGDQVRDFLDVAEAGRMIADVSLSTVQGAVNICSGIPISVRALAESIADEYGRRDLLRFGAVRAHPSDPPRIVGVRDRRFDSA